LWASPAPLRTPVVTAITTLAQATTIVEATLAKGRELSLDPLTVVVLDPGGHVVALKREDGSGILRPQIATGKAWARWVWDLPAGSWRGGPRRTRRSSKHFAASPAAGLVADTAGES
jgi:uncharacterized protein GlcG (DUF336 family)